MLFSRHDAGNEVPSSNLKDAVSGERVHAASSHFTQSIFFVFFFFFFLLSPLFVRSHRLVMETKCSDGEAGRHSSHPAFLLSITSSCFPLYWKIKSGLNLSVLFFLSFSEDTGEAPWLGDGVWLKRRRLHMETLYLRAQVEPLSVLAAVEAPAEIRSYNHP